MGRAGKTSCWDRKWFHGIVWEMLRETLRETFPHSTGRLRTKTLWWVMRCRLDAHGRFSDASVSHWGAWRKGAAPRGSAPFGDMGTGAVRAAAADEVAAMWPAAVSAMRLNASQDTSGAGAGSRDVVPVGTEGHAALCSPADTVLGGLRAQAWAGPVSAGSGDVRRWV